MEEHQRRGVLTIPGQIVTVFSRVYLRDISLQLFNQDNMVAQFILKFNI